MKHDLSRYVTVEQIDQFLAEYVKTLDENHYEPYDASSSFGMREQEHNALAFLYSSFTEALCYDQADIEYLRFIVRYDATHPNATYTYYSGPTISPDVAKTTLREILIDAITFDADFEDYQQTLKNLIAADFVELTITPSTYFS